MKPEPRSCQVKVLPNNIVMGYSEGTVLYITPSMAKTLVDQKAVRIIGHVNVVGPTETKPLSPAELKKSSDGNPSGPSTASAPSNPSGSAQPSSASEGDRASPSSNAKPPGEPATPADQYEGLRSTTRIRLRRGRT